MSGMVLTQLLNPDSGIERAGPERPAGGAPGGPEAGPSRYEEIVRQQEKRLDQRRQQERADQKAALAERRQERPAETGGGQPRPAEAAEHDRSRGKDTEVSDPENRQEAVAGRPRDASGEETAAGPAGVKDIVEVEGEDLVLPFAWMGNATPSGGKPASVGVPATSAGSLTAAGQAGNGVTAGNALFAALLEGGKDRPAGSRELLAGLQGNQLQALGADSGGKPGELLTAQVASRFSGALDLASQQLASPGAMKGPEASALMRSYSTSIDVPVGANEWGDKVMGKLAWLTASQMSVAEIHITPPDLGPLDVRVQVQNDQATVTVHAATPAVREQLELHGHRLRDMLSEQGIGLEGFDVSDSGGRGGADDGPGDDPGSDGSQSGTASALADGETSNAASGELDLSWKGEVDLYA